MFADLSRLELHTRTRSMNSQLKDWMMKKSTTKGLSFWRSVSVSKHTGKLLLCIHQVQSSILIFGHNYIPISFIFIMVKIRRLDYFIWTSAPLDGNLRIMDFRVRFGCKKKTNKEQNCDQVQESYTILSTEEERRLYDWSLARSEKPDRYVWPFEVDITQAPKGTPPPPVSNSL